MRWPLTLDRYALLTMATRKQLIGRWSGENGSEIIAALMQRSTDSGWRDLSRTLPFAEEIDGRLADLRGIVVPNRFLDLDLSYTDLSFAVPDPSGEQLLEFDRCQLNGAVLRSIKKEVIVRACDASGADFSGSNLSRNYFARSLLRDTMFERSRLRSAVFSGTELLRCSFRGADLSSAEFADCRCVDVDFSSAKLRKAFFEDATFLGSTSFEGADTTGVYFDSSDIDALVSTTKQDLLKAAEKDLKHIDPDLHRRFIAAQQASDPVRSVSELRDSLQSDERARLDSILQEASRK